MLITFICTKIRYKNSPILIMPKHYLAYFVYIIVVVHNTFTSFCYHNCSTKYTSNI